MKKIHIVGTCGSGKSTLASRLSKKLGIEHIELDDIFWSSNWTNIGKKRLSEIVEKKIQNKKSWIISGNFTDIQNIIHKDCDTIIWLDYPFIITLSRLLYRSFKRVITREKCCNGNRETIINLLFSKRSIILFMINNFKKRKAYYTKLKKDLKNSNIDLLHLKKPKEALKIMKQ